MVVRFKDWCSCDEWTKNGAVKIIGEVENTLWFTWWEDSRVGEETTWGGRLFQTGIMVEGRYQNLYGSLDGLNGIYLHGWNPCVCLVDGVSHFCLHHVMLHCADGLTSHFPHSSFQPIVVCLWLAGLEKAVLLNVLWMAGAYVSTGGWELGLSMVGCSSCTIWNADLTNTAGIVPAIARWGLPCTTSLYHFHFLMSSGGSKPWQHTPSGAEPMTDKLTFWQLWRRFLDFCGGGQGYCELSLSYCR